MDDTRQEPGITDFHSYPKLLSNSVGDVVVERKESASVVNDTE